MIYSLHSHSYEESIKKRAIEYVNDRIEKFDCNLSHVYKWIQLFVFMHNGKISSKISIIDVPCRR
ncbi:MAG TPA: hypothetical protein VHJ38_01145 [Nitrososphaeraceae archaeon]|nr:hypothetical protein [Nitrososphaeraceae archaeon]